MTDDSDTKSEGVSKKSGQDLTKVLKRRFENWREVIALYQSVLAWEKPYYPGVIVGIVTLHFLLLWYFSPSILTTISLFGIASCIFDYFVPILSAKFFDSNKWTASDEKKFEEFCIDLSNLSVQIKSMFDYVCHLKETKPYLYFVGVVGTLIFTAWIGNVFDNFFLTYLIVLISLLLPGIKSHQLVQENISKVTDMIYGIIGSEGTKKKK